MQKIENEDERFEKSISFWTLKFNDPDEEEIFQKKIDGSFRLPLVFRIIVYIGIAYQFVFRIYKMIAVLYMLDVKAGTFMEEFLSALAYGVACLIELFLRVTGKFKPLQGTALYIVFPLMCVYAAFFTQKAPLFGVLYFISDNFKIEHVLL